MDQSFTITNYDQLRALSDPFRVKILALLIEGSYTGQQIAQHLEIPRAKIHYHLNELEKFGYIEVVRTEAKNGIIQKFYRAVAYSFRPADDLLPYTVEVGDYYRHAMLEVLGRAKDRVLSAPEEAFQTKEQDVNKRSRMSVQAEIRASEGAFLDWLGKFRAVIKELDDLTKTKDAPDAKWFYFAGIGFQIDEPRFANNEEEPSGDIENPETKNITPTEEEEQ
ncbi:DNA-binding transcriptional ArsR family regulator [Paenibacillus phyllosphaerae]|uniref:DNA-binding transcriptional ArsR family regulator n=1 Tax=Paenibacillus phyllosphaerae TaxID=274593 RepID=A0A7W5FRB5_9BACL|nr:winged helix-turn-helix domain-containing protein [Paenibacillus phyllosphaerae]MBB3113864.1 DNA-binding transcriptional ArsR family regulator [Paenibacillus phyllosphaerae]